MNKPTVINSSELGTNCWRAERFTGGECQRIDTCKYPEKKTCKAYSDRVKIIRIPYRVHAGDSGGSMKKAIKTIGMHRDMVQLISYALWCDIEAITPKVIEYIKPLNKNQTVVFWRVTHAIHEDNANQLYLSSKEFREVLDSCLIGNREMVILMDIPNAEFIKMYNEAVEAL